MTPWRVMELGEVSLSVNYGYTASATDRDTGVQFLRTTDIVDGPVDWISVPYCEISDDDLDRFRLLPGDIVISRMGTVGVSALVRGERVAVPASYLVRFTLDESIVLPEYVYYVLQSTQWWDYVTAVKTGSVQPNFNAKLMRAFAFPVPPLDEQRRVALALAALDDRLESNRRIAHIARELARVTFKSILASEAPSPMRLGELVAFRYGKALPEKSRQIGTVPVYGSAGVIGTHSVVLVDGPAVIVGRKGRPGTVYFSREPCWPIDTAFWLEPRTELSMPWLFLAVEDLNLGRLSTDTAVPGLSRDMAEGDEVLVPNRRVQGRIDDAVGPLLELQESCSRENRKVTEFRDALLPELLSGRMKVRDAEAFAEEVS